MCGSLGSSGVGGWRPAAGRPGDGERSAGARPDSVSN